MSSYWKRVNASVSIEPSILSADFNRLGEQVKEAEAAGAKGVQIDVMDGHFVPNFTFGAGTVRGLRKISGLYLDVHLMVDNPDNFLSDFAGAGADRIIVHCEASKNVHKSLKSIKALKVEAGVAINPETTISEIEPVIGLADCVQVMTVNPGFAGQKFMTGQLDKVEKLKSKLKESGLPALIAVDGGIDAHTAPLAVRSGASILVAGSSVFNTKGSVAENFQVLRKSLNII